MNSDAIAGNWLTAVLTACWVLVRVVCAGTHVEAAGSWCVEIKMAESVGEAAVAVGAAGLVAILWVRAGRVGRGEDDAVRAAIAAGHGEYGNSE